MHTLKANNLGKSYKNRKVVKDVSLNISSGEIVGLLGPNGAGKTTSFYMIVGLIPNEEGSVYFDDTNITHLPMHERARLGIGYLPQETSVFRRLTVEQNIMAILELRKELDNQQRLDLTDQLLHELHVSHIRDTLGMSLSGGERRRVEIARALATEPAFILLDEPFAGVDPISVIDIKRIITHLCERDIGILITDHNVRETLDICQRAYIVNEGQIICDGKPEAILKNKKVREVYLGEDFYL
ncbi:MAG: LPS export ABC transporter ATP-binding protein [Legionellales bacterium]|nr:LPS export ABC transporter ATP-binding protein [Legionellales bacterium]|tara:strand:+ start:9321 stop:10046 length:726 start_codon:yes stop_codon:yes gene_type:complete